jgi:hypothetical protein
MLSNVVPARRAFRSAAFSALLASAGGGCGALGALGAPSAGAPAGAVAVAGRPHAWQTASIAYGFSSGQTVQWRATVAAVERDALPMLTAVRDGGHAMQLVVTPRRANEGREGVDHTEYYDADLAFVPAGGAAKAAGRDGAGLVVVPGYAGMGEAAYGAAAGRAARALGLSPELVRGGHFALYGLVNMMTALNVANASLQDHAFALVVMREKVKAGEKADWFGGDRPPPETLDDVDVALRVVADHQAQVEALRAEVLGLVALANAYKAPGAVDALRAQLAESARRNDAWAREHHQPTPEEFGVGARAARLPPADGLLAKLDERGYLAAALKVARGVATADFGGVLEGVKRFAPEDGSVRVVLDGLTAASRGDLAGSAGAVAKLVGRDARLAPLAERLDKVNGAVAATKGGATQVAEALRKPPSDLEGLRRSLQGVSGGVELGRRGATQATGALGPAAR